MTTPEPKTIEETWWEVTTTAGLMLTLPAPLKDIDTPHDPWLALSAAKSGSGPRVFRSTSSQTGRTYALDLGEALVIGAFTRTFDTSRMERSVAKALGILSPSPSDAGPEVASRPDPSTTPSGGSTNVRGKRTLLH